MKKLSIKKNKNLFFEEPIEIENKKINKFDVNYNNQQNVLNQKLSLNLLQKHLSILKLEEILIIFSLITIAVLGRILLQPLPSIEPITFIALLAGSLFGIKKGISVGASSWYLSNFFMFGGQGPWTFVHVLSGIVSGALGGIILKKPTLIKSVLAITLSTIIFEIAINTMSGILFYGILTSFITAIPFSITHLISNIIFASILHKSSTIIFKKAKLNEIEMCKNFISKLKQKRVETNEF